MAKKITLSGLIFFLTILCRSQNPGLIISEFNQNPAGTDSPFEYIEFLVVADIDFSVTPYTVIVCNNGTATADGWIAGGNLSYAFEITTGNVSVGDVVYVGGTSMAPSGIQIRTINTGTTGGDGGIGLANTGGVVGNGGGNSDGIAVFNLPVTSVTSSTVPVDAVFYGDGSGPGHGGTIVNGGLDGYELPVNDLYSGGKLQPGSFLALDADITVAQGNYDITTNSFTVARTFTSGAMTSGISDIALTSSPPPVLSFATTHATYNENAGTVTVDISITSSNSFESSADLVIRSASTASLTSDFLLSTSSISFPPSSSGSLSVTIDIVDDMIEEQSEYIILSLENFTNADVSTGGHFFLYITDNDRFIPAPTNELKFELLTSYSNGAEGSNSAEIVAYDSSNYRLFIANSIGNNLDIVDFSDPSLPTALMSINLDSIGAVNSVAAYNGVVAVAIENLNPQQNGYITFFDGNGNWLKRLDVGAMPDMLTFSANGQHLVVACEGEPSDDYLTDPEGTIAVLDMIYPVTSMTNSDVMLVNFNTLDGTEVALISEGIRIFGPGASVSQDFEPEYVTILNDGITAFITLQENNAIAIVDIQTKTLIDVFPLGTIDHNVFGYGMDVSNVTSAINIANFPVKGLFLPDAIATLNIGGNNYLFTANEGDTRDYSGFSEETRIKDESLDPTIFPDAIYLKDNYLLGRLIMTNTMGDDLNDGDFEELYTIGTRSFSIWDAATGTLVFDSGDLIEQIISNHPNFQNLFNASNTAGGVSQKNRSDDKGPEVEGVTTATIEGNHFVFVSLERIGGVLIFNVNDPFDPQFVGYENNRDLLTNGPDRGAEGILFIDANASPNGNSILLLANEVSSTVTVFQLNSCAELSDLSVSVENGLSSFCENDSLQIEAASATSLNFQWFQNSFEIVGATTNVIYAYSDGYYQVEFENAVEMCTGKTDSLFITMLPAPVPTIFVTDAVLSTQIFTSYQWYFESVQIAGATSQEYTPTVDGEYMVVVTNADGCEGYEIYNVNFTSFVEQFSNVLSIYPNPAANSVYIELPNNSESIIKITDMKGSVIFEELIITSDSVYEIPVDFLQNGIYLVTLTNNEDALTTTLVVKK